MKNQESKMNYETKALPEIFKELEETRYSQVALRKDRKESTYFYQESKKS